MDFWDKLVPTQHEYSKLYKGGNYAIALHDEILRVSRWAELALDAPEGFELEDMASSPVTLRFIQSLLKMRRAQSVLEIGCFVGASALAMASVLPKHGNVTTIERHKPFAQIAQRNFDRHAAGEKITLRVGDAMEHLSRASLPLMHYDVVFIDGDKARYLDYLKRVRALNLVSRDGMILIDDCFFHGDALNAEPETEKGRGVKRLLDYVATDDCWDVMPIPIGNGLLMLT